jgi:DNA processing protein
MKDSTFYWVALTLVPGIGRITFRKLLQRFKHPRAVFSASRQELSTIRGLKESSLEHIYNFKIEPKAEQEINKAVASNYAIITWSDSSYPRYLREIPDPPLVLYVYGELSTEDESSIAIVGTRAPSTYGKLVAEKLSVELVKRGLTIVSGLARGIDTAAHRGALTADGRTIAVKGCGLDVHYPPENKKLSDKIAQAGALVSELPLGTPPASGNFYTRNRIISGFSLGTVVVEASEKSGALITANHTLDQNRELYAVPGNITSPKSLGCNYLIKRGAKLVQCWQDVVEELPPKIKDNLLKEQQNDNEEEPPSMSKEEKAIFNLLSPDKPIHIDTLTETLKMEQNLLLSKLLSLEIKESIVQLPGKMFVRKI